MVNPLDHPEASSLFKTLLLSLTAESDRGALLVGVAHLDMCFQNLFEAVFAPNASKKLRKDLLRYPGPLGSLAARNDLAFAMRLIPESTYNAANALRGIRNDAAHHPEDFTLKGYESRIQGVYAAMGETLPGPGGLRSIAMDMLLEYKSGVIIDFSRDEREKDPELDIDISTKEQVLAFIADKPDIIQALDRELLRWELSIGIALLCSSLILFRERVAEVLGNAALISKLSASAVFVQSPE